MPFSAVREQVQRMNGDDDDNNVLRRTLIRKLQCYSTLIVPQESSLIK